MYLNILYNNLNIDLIQDSFGPPNDSVENKNQKTNLNSNTITDDKLSKIISEIINYKIKTQLTQFISIIHNKIKKIYREIFPYIFSKSGRSYVYIDYEKSKMNLKKAIVLHKIKSSCLNLFEIYK